MLGKMILQGLVGAIVIGSAAAVYAQAKELSPPVLAEAPGDVTAKAGDGYLRADSRASGLRDGVRERAPDRERNHDHMAKAGFRRDGHDGRRGHDDDD